ncbi:MAG: hemolysin III family protein [Oscillospiraceae bacterium]
MTRTKLTDRKLPDYLKSEEIFNMVSHIAGGALGIIATVFCIIVPALKGDVYGVIGGAIFGGSMILLYAMSSIYHGLSPKLTAKKVFQVLDHCAIFILIAGTYTPITLCSMRKLNPALGWTVFGVIWAMAFLGIALNSVDLKKYKKFSMICYLGMGWCVIAIAKQTGEALGVGGTVWLLLGGVFYTIGAALYALGKKKGKRYVHSVFHIFIVLGSVCHFFCILLYVL